MYNLLFNTSNSSLRPTSNKCWPKVVFILVCVSQERKRKNASITTSRGNMASKVSKKRGFYRNWKNKTKGRRRRLKRVERRKNPPAIIVCIYMYYATRNWSTEKDQCSAGDIQYPSIERRSKRRREKLKYISWQIRAQRKVERDANFDPFTYLWYMLVVNEVETWLDGDRDGSQQSFVRPFWSSATTVTSITSARVSSGCIAPWRCICILHTYSMYIDVE